MSPSPHWAHLTAASLVPPPAIPAPAAAPTSPENPMAPALSRMTTKRNFTVTRRGGLFAALLLIGSAASAEPVGSVGDANGTLLARAASGSIKVLVVGSTVERGDTLFTREGTYALVKLSDQSSVSLGPETELSVATYSFHEAAEDPKDS